MEFLSKLTATEEKMKTNAYIFILYYHGNFTLPSSSHKFLNMLSNEKNSLLL